MPPRCAACGKHPLGDIGIVGRTEQRHHIQFVGRRRDRQQFEIAGMCGEDDERLFGVAKPDEVFDAVDFYSSSFGGCRIVIEKLVEKDIFRGKPGHVAPHFDGDLMPFGFGFSG